MPPKRKAISTNENEFRHEPSDVEMANKFGMIYLFRRYAEVSSISGIPQLQRSQQTIRSIIWTLIVLTGCGVLIWQCQAAIVKYLSNGVTTVVTRKAPNALDYPAVTLCNQNPIDYKKIEKVNKNIFNTIQTWEASNQTSSMPSNGPNASTASSTSTVKQNTNEMPNINGLGGRSSDETYERQLQLQALISPLTNEDKMNVGMSIENMLISCYFNNYQCNTSDFYRIYNYQYGNCYTYNLLSNKSTLQTLEIGPQYGLKMILFINSSAYIPLTVNSGVRILIHHPTEYPFPEDVGIGASPGKLNSVGLNLITASIQQPPYNKCLNRTLKQSQELSAYVGLLPNVSYTKEGCIKTCTQKYILMNCGCYHPFIPYNSSMDAYKNISSTDLRMCDINLRTTDAICIANTKIGIRNGTYDCTNCTLVCTKYSYSTTISQTNWPSDISTQSIVNQLNNLPDMKSLQQSINVGSIITNQILQVEIYFDTLTYLDISETPAYDMFSLISDLGGQMGLWLGLSIAGFLEIFELIYDTILTYIKILIIKHRDKKRRKAKTALTKVAWKKF